MIHDIQNKQPFRCVIPLNVSERTTIYASNSDEFWSAVETKVRFSLFRDYVGVGQDGVRKVIPHGTPDVGSYTVVSRTSTMDLKTLLHAVDTGVHALRNIRPFQPNIVDHEYGQLILISHHSSLWHEENRLSKEETDMIADL